MKDGHVKPVLARLVDISWPARRCCADGCGDKIKSGADNQMYSVTFEGGDVRYLETGCVGWFIYGHPDHETPLAYGWCEGLPMIKERKE